MRPSGKTETVTITRDAVPLPSIPQAYMIKPGVGYVAMTGGFNLTTSDEFQAALEDLHSKGMNMLVLDLRGNRGGLLIQAVSVANTFLQRDQLIVTQKGRIRAATEPFSAVNDASRSDAVGRAGKQRYSIGGGDRCRRFTGSRPRVDRGREHVRQRPGPTSDSTRIRLSAVADGGQVLHAVGRLIQRDYSNGGFYDYYTHGGVVEY